jgi:hypothetical protein
VATLTVTRRHDLTDAQWAVQALKAEGKGIKTIRRELGLAKEDRTPASTGPGRSRTSAGTTPGRSTPAPARCDKPGTPRSDSDLSWHAVAVPCAHDP